jgi:hypothetical protein
MGPAFAELPAGETAVIRPGGATTCARGAPFSFFVAKGRADRVVFDFSGGGACWNAQTCAFASYLFSDTVPDAASVKPQGIYDRNNRANPFRDWTHVFVPYCTGDVHWGDNAATYGDVTIQHKGAANVRAVLAWLFAEVKNPERLFVTGCSAGAYGSVVWAPRLRRHYPKAALAQLGDSGAGVITDSFFAESQASWRPQGSYPAWIVGDTPFASLGDIYTRVAAAYPEDTFGQFNMLRDSVQVRFFTAMGGSNADEWSQRMRASSEAIAAAAPNYRYALAAGEEHCILPYDTLYTKQVGGRAVVDWVADLAEGRSASNLRD